MEYFLNPKFQILDATGAPLSGGKVSTYEAGTSTPKTTYSDRGLVTANANPVILDSRGEAIIFFSGSMKIVVTDSDDTAVYTLDNIKGQAITTTMVDADGDTKIQVEESADEDKIRFDTAGSERLVVDTLIRPKVAIEMPSVAIQDADGDTKIQVEEGADDDTIRFDCAGAEQVIIQDGAILPTLDNDIDIGSIAKALKDVYVQGQVKEGTTDAGVTIDGLHIKDGKITTVDAIDSDQYTDDSIDSAHYAPDSVDQTAMGASAVGQVELKTTTGSVSSAGGNVTLPGGTYAFYPQIKSDYTGDMSAQIAFEAMIGTSYVTNIYLLKVGGSGSIRYAQSRYVQASGEVHWIFILRDKITKDIISMYQAPDHPCFGNGGDPNDVPHPF